jgi:hypothetical protein
MELKYDQVSEAAHLTFVYHDNIVAIPEDQGTAMMMINH